MIKNLRLLGAELHRPGPRLEHGNRKGWDQNQRWRSFASKLFANRCLSFRQQQPTLFCIFGEHPDEFKSNVASTVVRKSQLKNLFSYVQYSTVLSTWYFDRADRHRHADIDVYADSQ